MRASRRHDNVKDQLIGINVDRAAAEPAPDEGDASIAAERQVDIPLDILIGSDAEERLERVGEDHRGSAVGSQPICNRIGRSLRSGRRCRGEIDHSQWHRQSGLLPAGG